VHYEKIVCMPLYNGFMCHFDANKFIGGHVDDQLQGDSEA